jgi:hypothetical protein
MVELGFVELEPIEVGANIFHPLCLDFVHPLCLDFGPGSVDGWLAGLAARELGVDDTSLLDPQARELIVDGRRMQRTEALVLGGRQAPARRPVYSGGTWLLTCVPW